MNQVTLWFSAISDIISDIFSKNPFPGVTASYQLHSLQSMKRPLTSHSHDTPLATPLGPPSNPQTKARPRMHILPEHHQHPLRTSPRLTHCPWHRRLQSHPTSHMDNHGDDGRHNRCVSSITQVLGRKTTPRKDSRLPSWIHSKYGKPLKGYGGDWSSSRC